MRRTIVHTLQFRKGVLLPQFNLQHRWLYINHQRFPLMRKPLTRKLLAAFLANPLKPLTRDELIDAIYDDYAPELKSERYNKILKTNLNKLMSRTRCQLDGCFNEHKRWIEFLVYEPSIEGWSFYRLHNDFISSRGVQKKAS